MSRRKEKGGPPPQVYGGPAGGQAAGMYGLSQGMPMHMSGKDDAFFPKFNHILKYHKPDF